jgi:8-oxo-dGTP pyrophosphatase MutT (NUDIX family)
MQNPWEKLSSNSVYKNNWIEVFQDDVLFKPNKKKGIYGVVKTKGGVGIVVLNNENEICLVSQYRYPPDVYSLEIPKGALDSSEDSIGAAKRELKEETGMEGKIWKELGMVHTLMGYSNDKVHLFLATDLTMSESNPESTEVIRIHYVSINQIEKVINEGLLIDGKKIKISDATSIAALFLAKNLLSAVIPTVPA